MEERERDRKRKLILKLAQWSTQHKSLALIVDKTGK